MKDKTQEVNNAYLFNGENAYLSTDFFFHKLKDWLHRKET